jgi:hypothetical protein
MAYNQEPVKSPLAPCAITPSGARPRHLKTRMRGRPTLARAISSRMAPSSRPFSVHPNRHRPSGTAFGVTVSLSQVAVKGGFVIEPLGAHDRLAFSMACGASGEHVPAVPSSPPRSPRSAPATGPAAPDRAATSESVRRQRLTQRGDQIVKPFSGLAEFRVEPASRVEQQSERSTSCWRST